MVPTATAYPIFQADESPSTSSAFRNGTVNPINDGGTSGPVTLDVGQHAEVSSRNAVLGTLLILLGLMQVFFGFRLIRITLFITGFSSWGKYDGKGKLGER
jgi:hypothetical protein